MPFLKENTKVVKKVETAKFFSPGLLLSSLRVPLHPSCTIRKWPPRRRLSGQRIVDKGSEGVVGTAHAINQMRQPMKQR